MAQHGSISTGNHVILFRSFDAWTGCECPHTCSTWSSHRWIDRRKRTTTYLLWQRRWHVAKMPWASLLIYVLLRFMQGNMGVIGAIRSYAWIPIGQYSYRELSTRAFEHVHSLSLDFHLTKKTGEVLSALSKGSAINSFLEQILFQIFPVVVDLVLVSLLSWMG